MKEKFCGLCLSVPLTMLVGYGSTAIVSGQEYARRKKLVIGINAVIIALAIIALIYLSSGSCSECVVK